MKTPISYLLFVIATILTASIQARGPYSNLSTGVFKTGDFGSWSVGATIGYEMRPLWSNVYQSVEAEILYLSSNELDLLPYNQGSSYSYKDEINQIPLFINYKLSSSIWQSSLIGYIGAGVGLNHIQFKSNDNIIFASGSEGKQQIQISTTIFAVQGFVGLSYPMFNQVWLNIEGKLMNMKKYKFQKPNTMNETKSIQAGLEIGLTYYW